MFDAVVLAGAPNTGKLAEVAPERYEALITAGGRTLVEWVVRGVAQARSVGRIAVVGPADELEKVLGPLRGELPEGKVVIVPMGGSVVENLKAGIEALNPPGRVLVVTSDIPFINGEAIDDFAQRCAQAPADIHYSVVSKEANEARFPGVKRTYVKIQGDVLTGGNIAAVDPRALLSHEDLINRAVALRKKPLALLRLLGFGFIVKFILGRLTIRDIEERASRMLGLTARAVISPYAEIGVDVDKPSDLELARRELAR